MTRRANSAAASMRACSACDGDYEDPERTAWSDAREDEGAEAEVGDREERAVTHERFPVREE